MQGVHPELPKELLPVAGRPAIQRAIEEARVAGIDRIVIVLSSHKEQIRRYVEEPSFARGLYPRAAAQMERLACECSISFCYQARPRGEADAIAMARQSVGNDALAVLYPDNIVSPPGAVKDLAQAYRLHGRDVTALMPVTEANASRLSNSGRVDLEPVAGAADNLFRIVKIHAKGKGAFVPRWSKELRTCGIAVFGPHLFGIIERLRRLVDDQTELTDGAVRQLMLHDRDLLGLQVEQSVFDIGNPAGYVHCQRCLDRGRSC